MSWNVSHTQGVVHDKPLIHGGNRWGLLNNGGRVGYGSGATGGLYADEVKVTTLADSSVGPAGSFRAACGVNRPKWITFKPGMTAPPISSWASPYSNAPLSAWKANQVFNLYGHETPSGNTTIDGRGDVYSIAGNGVIFTAGNGISHGFEIDFSQWWRGNLNTGLFNIWDATATYSRGMQPIQTTGASVNGETYLTAQANLNDTRGYGDRDWWFDHMTLRGVAYGDGAAGHQKTASFWDFNDGGISICYRNHHLTASWCSSLDMNKTLIIGCSSAPTEILRYFADWITMHHNYVLGGIQRQPLSREGHVHIFSNYYARPGTPPNGGQIIVADPGSCMFYEGNLGDSLGWSSCPLALSRDSTGFIIGHQGETNTVLGGMTIPADHGSLTFHPTDEYAYDASDLRVLGNNNFKTLITNGAGA